MFEFILDASYILLWLIVVSSCIFFTSKLVLNFVEKMLCSKSKGYLGSVFSSAAPPALFLVGVWVARLTYHLMHNKIEAPFFAGEEFQLFISQVVWISLPLSFGWFLLRLLASFRSVLLVKTNNKVATDWVLIIKIGQICVVLVFLLLIAEKLGFNVNSILTFGGIGGIAVGLAAKDTLANFFGSLVLSIDKPFDVGDAIFSPDREIEGTVQEIGWRFTRVISPDRMSVYIPNSLFTSIVIYNRTKIVNRRVRFKVRIRYVDHNTPVILSDKIQEKILNLDAVVSQGTMVTIELLGSAIVDLDIIAISSIVTYAGTLQLRQAIILAIDHVVREMGCEVVFPASIVELELNAKHPVFENRSS